MLGYWITYKNETAGIKDDTRCLLSPGEKPIPGGLLPSRAHFRFGSQCKIHNKKLYLQPAYFSDHLLTDDTAENVVILTTTEKTQIKNSPDEGYKDGALYAYHYSISGDSIKQTWRVYDYVKECPVDMILYFVDKAFAVTDLNKDGRAEVWIMYKVSCQGDVSPIPMKIIMYQNNEKFAVRGTTRVKVSATEFMGGEYTFDEAFKNAPVEFRQYAEKLWKQHKLETWGQ